MRVGRFIANISQEASVIPARVSGVREESRIHCQEQGNGPGFFAWQPQGSTIPHRSDGGDGQFASPAERVYVVRTPGPTVGTPRFSVA